MIRRVSVRRSKTRLSPRLPRDGSSSSHSALRGAVVAATAPRSAVWLELDPSRGSLGESLVFDLLTLTLRIIERQRDDTRRHFLFLLRADLQPAARGDRRLDQRQSDV